MALDGTEKGKRKAAQALSRIGISQDPSIAFPGQRVCVTSLLDNASNYIVSGVPYSKEIVIKFPNFNQCTDFSYYFSYDFFSLQAVDIIRPICLLLNAECDGIENFEALLALGNIATVGESTRTRMLKENDFVHQIGKLNLPLKNMTSLRMKFF